MTDLREQFWRDGVTVVRGVATSGWVDRLRESLASHLASPSDRLKELGSAESGRFVNGHGLLGAMPELGAFLSTSCLASLVRGLFDGGPVALIDDQVFAKAPSTADVMPWHQDGSFWPINGDMLCTSWLALDAVTPDTGGLEVVLGSHRWNRIFQAVGARRDPQLIDPGHEPLPPDSELRERHRIACPRLAAGDALVFHALTLHRSGPNTSATAWRRGIVLRWAGGNVRYDGRERAAPRARETAERHGLHPGDGFIGKGFPEF